MKLLLLILASVGFAQASNPLAPAAPVPSSPYLPLIYRYADAVLEKHDGQNFLRLLYTLSELSGKPKYRDAADATLRRFLQDPPAESSRPWLLWNRCFEIAREPATQWALRLVKKPTTNHPGFDLRAWSAAYARTTNEMFLRATETLVARLEASEAAANVSLAIDCDGAAHGLPPPLAARLRALAQREDNAFCSLPKETSARLWNLWDGSNATAKLGMMCVSRYENTGNVAYRDRVHAAANAYTTSSPPKDAGPATLGQAISLQVAAWRSTARQAHLDKAREFADFAIPKFFKPDLHETTSGMGTLALALTELHLHILYITAVRCPANTIDR